MTAKPPTPPKTAGGVSPVQKCGWQNESIKGIPCDVFSLIITEKPVFQDLLSPTDPLSKWVAEKFGSEWTPEEPDNWRAVKSKKDGVGSGDSADEAIKQKKDEAQKLGRVSEHFESGGRGPGTISTGKGDAGGASYGSHQLASKTGTLQNFLRSSKYGEKFKGLTPGTPAFNAKWTELATNDKKDFGAAQDEFITKTHYEPQVGKLAGNGMDLSDRGPAVQEAIYSTSVQFGPNSSVISNALKGKDVSKMSDAEIASAIQDYKIRNNEALFKSSSPAVRAGTLRRAQNEKTMLLDIAAKPVSQRPPPAGARTFIVQRPDPKAPKKPGGAGAKGIMVVPDGSIISVIAGDRDTATRDKLMLSLAVNSRTGYCGKHPEVVITANDSHSSDLTKVGTKEIFRRTGQTSTEFQAYSRRGDSLKEDARNLALSSIVLFPIAQSIFGFFDYTQFDIQATTCGINPDAPPVFDLSARVRAYAPDEYKFAVTLPPLWEGKMRNWKKDPDAEPSEFKIEFSKNDLTYNLSTYIETIKKISSLYSSIIDVIMTIKGAAPPALRPDISGELNILVGSVAVAWKMVPVMVYDAAEPNLVRTQIAVQADLDIFKGWIAFKFGVFWLKAEVSVGIVVDAGVKLAGEANSVDDGFELASTGNVKVSGVVTAKAGEVVNMEGRVSTEVVARLKLEFLREPGKILDYSGAIVWNPLFISGTISFDVWVAKWETKGERQLMEKRVLAIFPKDL